MDRRGPTLIGTHAQSRVTLEMLGRLIALALGQPQVVEGDVAGLVDKDAAALQAAQIDRAAPVKLSPLKVLGQLGQARQAQAQAAGQSAHRALG